MGNRQTLQARVLNCLLTIVELEPLIKKLPLDSDLRAEFKFIKSIVNQVNEFDLSENDVSRIERATATFLDEISVPLSIFYKDFKKQKLQ
ncbi:hypothetical protein KFV02_08715 [Desulfohalobiaceae bacterium Ax17]|uniref:hypothetical protein n=1 Tax=Desulfovulcanus ferrireducens TaxID=2831190 RepID=UPI00207BBC9E|nr:hypothetical protein [Desulfovulcanus ferrireducens]MBT8764010.1 hypothetical protein [Desulfovulcanus ferrireducens]